MNFSLDSDQEMLGAMVARFLANRYRFEQRRERLWATGGCDPEIWQELACELGLAGAPISAEAGGLGGGATEVMVIMEALGGALVTEPFLETVVLGGSLLAAVDDEPARELLRGIVAGDVRLAVAACEVSARFVLDDVATTARRVDGGWSLDGAKPVVWGAPCATHILVVTRTAGQRNDREGLSLFVVPAGHPGLEMHGYRLIDDRPAADLRLTRVQLSASALIGPEGGILPSLEEAMDRAVAALCADAVGGMRQMLTATVDYTKQRKQFGQPLASFQVLQHRMVDMYIALEQAVSAVHLATLNLDADPATRQRAVSAAKVTVARSARFVGQNAVQLHGGMGMTDELAVGHYFKRATVFEHAFGSADQHLQRYAECQA